MGGGGETSMASCLCCEIHSTQDLAILQKASSVCKKVSQRYILASSINLCISELDNFFLDSKQNRLHPRPPCLLLITEDFH